MLDLAAKSLSMHYECTQRPFTERCLSCGGCGVLQADKHTAVLAMTCVQDVKVPVLIVVQIMLDGCMTQMC